MAAVTGGENAAAARATGGDAAAVCVIGAGGAGLAAGRLLRDEGLRVTILEKSRHLGGVWRYHAGPGDEKAPMCESVCAFCLPWAAMAAAALHTWSLQCTFAPLISSAISIGRLLTTANDNLCTCMFQTPMDYRRRGSFICRKLQ